MASYLQAGFTYLIGSKWHEISNEGRFEFVIAKKRDESGQIRKTLIQYGDEKKKVDATYNYMVDKKAGLLYLVHSPSKLPYYFFMISLANPFVSIGAVSFNLLVSVVNLAKNIFLTACTIFSGYEALRRKIAHAYEEAAHDVCSLFKGIKYGVRIEFIALYALTQYRNPNALFALKVQEAKTEFLWNRRQNFNESGFSKTLQMSRAFIKCICSPREKSILALFKEIAQKYFPAILTRTNYIMPPFQPRGTLEAVTLFKQYASYSDFEQRFGAVIDPWQLQTNQSS